MYEIIFAENSLCAVPIFIGTVSFICRFQLSGRKSGTESTCIQLEIIVVLQKENKVKEISYQKFLDSDELEKLRMKIIVEKGKVINMVVQYETFFNSKWIPVVRYDCAHGFFHRDVLFPGGEKEKQTINITSLEDALNYAEQDIKDRWGFYKERYMKKIKK